MKIKQCKLDNGCKLVAATCKPAYPDTDGVIPFQQLVLNLKTLMSLASQDEFALVEANPARAQKRDMREHLQGTLLEKAGMAKQNPKLQKIEDGFVKQRRRRKTIAEKPVEMNIPSRSSPSAPPPGYFAQPGAAKWTTTAL
jgi:hypothetical protein